MWKPKTRVEPARPSRQRINQFALAILEQAVADARSGPIQRTYAHRLALAWLTYTEIATPSQAASLWDSLGHAGLYAGEGGAFYRSSDPPTYLAAWTRTAQLVE